MGFHIIIQKTTEEGANNSYILSNLSSLSMNLSSPLTPMPLPEESDDANILVKMEGNTQTINFSWKLSTETSAMIGSGIKTAAFTHSGGTWGLTTPDSTLLTQYDQILFLQNDFIPDGVSDAYAFYIYDDDDSSQPVFSEFGSVTEVNFNISGDSPVVWDARINFIVGNSIAAFESNSPERPTFVDVTSVTTGVALLDWKEFAGYAVGEDPTLTFTRIRYKPTTGGAWTTLTTTSTNADEVDYSISPLVTGEEYIFKVAHSNLEADGTEMWHWSKPRRVVIA
jgi:hypothetical protein